MAKSYIEHENITRVLRHFKFGGRVEDPPTENFKRRSAIRRVTLHGLNPCSTDTLLRQPIDPTKPIELNCMIYDEVSIEEQVYKKVEEIPNTPQSFEKKMMWIVVDGVHDDRIINELCARFGIHSLFKEGIQTGDQGTKLSVLDDMLFLVCKLLLPDTFNEEDNVPEQISFFVKENLLITFQPRTNKLFDNVIKRIQQGKGRIRRSKIDYLFYSLVDVIVDHYMDVLNASGMKIEEIDEELVKPLKRETLAKIYALKSKMLYYRSAIYPFKEIIIRLQKEEETQIMQESTNIYLKDLFDHVVQVNDSIDTYREMLASFIDFHMMINSNAMNKVVKTLTIISTIFIPLTFITGIYGMNFVNIPELRYENGYYIVLGVMASLAIFMLSIFKRKKWF